MLLQWVHSVHESSAKYVVAWIRVELCTLSSDRGTYRRVMLSWGTFGSFLGEGHVMTQAFFDACTTMLEISRRLRMSIFIFSLGISTNPRGFLA